MHSIRGGNIAGEHTVIYAGKDEIIELKHTANSKEVFGGGALKQQCICMIRNQGSTLCKIC